LGLLSEKGDSVAQVVSKDKVSILPDGKVQIGRQKDRIKTIDLRNGYFLTAKRHQVSLAGKNLDSLRYLAMIKCGCNGRHRADSIVFDGSGAAKAIGWCNQFQATTCMLVKPTDIIAELVAQ